MEGSRSRTRRRSFASREVSRAEGGDRKGNFGEVAGSKIFLNRKTFLGAEM